MLVEQNYIYYYITFRLCLVRVILGGMEKEMRKWRENGILVCLVGEENGQENWWGLGVFSPVPPECNLPNSGENSRENEGQKVPPERDQITTCNMHFHFVIFFFFDHTFFFPFVFFCYFLFLLAVHLFFLSSSVLVFFSPISFIFPQLFWIFVLFFIFYIMKFTSIHNFSIKI